MRPVVVCFSGSERLPPERREHLSLLLPDAHVLDPADAIPDGIVASPFVALSWGSSATEAIDAADRWMAVGRDVRWVVLVAPPHVLIRRPSVRCTIVVGSHGSVPIGAPRADIVRLEVSLRDEETADIEVTGVVAAGLLALG